MSLKLREARSGDQQEERIEADLVKHFIESDIEAFGTVDGFEIPTQGSPEYIHLWASRGFLLARQRLSLIGRPNKSMGGCHDVRLLPEGPPLEEFQYYHRAAIACYRDYCLRVRQAFENLSPQHQSAVRKESGWPLQITDHLAKSQRLPNKIFSASLPEEIFAIQAEEMLAGLRDNGQSFERLSKELVNFMRIGVLDSKKRQCLTEMNEEELQTYYTITECEREFYYSYWRALAEGDEALRQALFAFGNNAWSDAAGRHFDDINQMLQFHTPNNGFYLNEPHRMQERPYKLRVSSVYDRGESN